MNDRRCHHRQRPRLIDKALIATGVADDRFRQTPCRPGDMRAWRDDKRLALQHFLATLIGADRGKAHMPRSGDQFRHLDGGGDRVARRDRAQIADPLLQRDGSRPRQTGADQRRHQARRPHAVGDNMAQWAARGKGRIQMNRAGVLGQGCEKRDVFPVQGAGQCGPLTDLQLIEGPVGQGVGHDFHFCRT